MCPHAFPPSLCSPLIVEYGYIFILCTQNNDLTSTMCFFWWNAFYSPCGRLLLLLNKVWEVKDQNQINYICEPDIIPLNPADMSVALRISISWHEIMMNGLDRDLFLLGYGKRSSIICVGQPPLLPILLVLWLSTRILILLISMVTVL